MKENRLPAALSLFVALVSLSGIVVLIGAGLDWQGEDATLLISLAALAVLCEVFDFSPFPNSRVSLSIGLIFAAGALAALPGVAVIASAAAAADYVAHRKPLVKALFNHGAMLASGAAYVGVLEAFSSTHDSGDWMAVLGPALLGCIASFALNSALVTVAIALDSGRNPFTIWNSAFRWLLPHYIILGALALLLAIAYERWELGGMALLILPFAMSWLIIKQYSDRVPRPMVAPAEPS